MHKIGIIVNTSKDKNFKITNSIIDWIEKNGGQALIEEPLQAQLGRNIVEFSSKYIYENSDFLIVLGGDGTLLNTAREVAKYQTPILGVNLGHLGFLAEVEVKEIFNALESAFNDNISIENRLMLQATIYGNNKELDCYALNDIIITRGTLSRIITMKTYINNNYFSKICGDGLIIASPTGSTAYSLSAGGPIISPNLSVMMLTPICPHSLSNRSIIISDDEIIKVDFSENHGDAYLTIDGQKGYKINPGEYILIKKAPFKTKLVKLSSRSFFDVLRTKLAER